MVHASDCCYLVQEAKVLQEEGGDEMLETVDWKEGAWPCDEGRWERDWRVNCSLHRPLNFHPLHLGVW